MIKKTRLFKVQKFVRTSDRTSIISRTTELLLFLEKILPCSDIPLLPMFSLSLNHLLSNSKSLVWYGSPCIGFLLGPRLHVILCPQHEKESAKPEIQKVVAHSPYLHQNGSLKKINWSLVVTFYMYVYLFYVLLVIHVGRLLMGSLEHENIWWMHM